MKPHYITRGIQTTIPPWLQTLLWYMRDSMEVPERDYLQIFRLSCDGDPSQTTLTWWEAFCFGILDLSKRQGW